MSFGTFLTLLDRITWKKLQKRAKNGIMKKTPFLKKNEKTQIFFLRWAINHPKIIKKSKFLCSITSHAPKTTEKNFHGHWDNIHEMKSRFLKKKHSWKNPGEVRIVAECKNYPKMKNHFWGFSAGFLKQKMDLQNLMCFFVFFFFNVWFCWLTD